MAKPTSRSLESDSWEAAVLISACESICWEGFAKWGEPFRIRLAGISYVFARLGKDDYVELKSIDRIYKMLGADISDVLDFTNGYVPSEQTGCSQTSQNIRMTS